MRAWIIAAALMLTAAGTRLAAHPTAASFVVIGVGSSTVEVAITTDERALTLKLGALAKPVEALIDLRIDGLPIGLSVRKTARLTDRPGQVRVILSAALPRGGRSLQWTSSLFLGSYPVAVQSGGAEMAPDGDRQYEWIAANESSRVYDLSDLDRPVGGWAGFPRLIGIGFTHILPGGLDHVLFVLGLTMLAANLRALFLQISLFTIAHSATLGLAMAGVVAVPGRIVEPLIAVSIAYVAIENLRATSLSYWRLVLVLGFGLLHGLGFAGALRDTGLEGGSFMTTLVGFNVGVELGQLAVVIAALTAMRLLPLGATERHRFVLRPASAVIAGIGLFWAIERTLLG